MGLATTTLPQEMARAMGKDAQSLREGEVQSGLLALAEVVEEIKLEELQSLPAVAIFVLWMQDKMEQYVFETHRKKQATQYSRPDDNYPPEFGPHYYADDDRFVPLAEALQAQLSGENPTAMDMLTAGIKLMREGRQLADLVGYLLGIITSFLSQMKDKPDGWNPSKFDKFINTARSMLNTVGQVSRGEQVVQAGSAADATASAPATVNLPTNPPASTPLPPTEPARHPADEKPSAGDLAAAIGVKVIEPADASGDSVQLTQLQAQVASLTEEKAAQTAELARLAAELAKTAATLQTTQGLLETEQAAHRALQAEHQQLLSDKAGVDKELEKINELFRCTATNHDNLVHTITELENNLRAARAEIESLTSKNADGGTADVTSQELGAALERNAKLAELVGSLTASLNQFVAK